MGALDGAELRIHDWRNGLSATVKSGAKGAEFFFGGPQVVQEHFLGVKNGWKKFPLKTTGCILGPSSRWFHECSFHLF